MMLQGHNELRALHHAPAMTLDKALNKYAQDWANRLAASGEFIHSRGPYGENLAYFASSLAIDAVAAGWSRRWLGPGVGEGSLWQRLFFRDGALHPDGVGWQFAIGLRFGPWIHAGSEYRSISSALRSTGKCFRAVPEKCSSLSCQNYGSWRKVC